MENRYPDAFKLLCFFKMKCCFYDRKETKMRKCKDCYLFKNKCGFSNVDEQVGLNGDFVACGQFVKVNDSKD